MKNIAVILASGNGTRFGSKLPKQFVKLAGKPVIQYTLEAFQKSSVIDEIIVVTGADYIDLVLDIAATNGFDKVCKVINGGKERYESSWSAIQAIEYDECNILFHDAVRPFVSQKIISDCVSALSKYNAVDVVVDPTDTIVKVINNEIMSIPDRRHLRRGQTPQAFKKSVVEKAYERFLKEETKVASDDCGIVLRYIPHEPIGVVYGDEANFKITHQQDLYLADNIIRDGLVALVDRNFEKIEKKLSDKCIVIFGGTSGIGSEISVLAKELGANVYSYGRSNGCDITNPSDVQNALKHVIEIENKIDYVINSAGLLLRKPIEFTSDEEVMNSIGVNYIGALTIAKYSFPYLKDTHGMLVNFTSSSYTRGRAGYSLYSSSKAAIVNLTQALSEEWESTGVKVNCINPERTDTPMRRKNFGIEAPETLLTAKEVADTTLSLMAMSYTGQIVSVKK